MNKKLVEALVVPLGLVPVGAGRIDLREDPVFGRASTPIAGNPRLHQPDIGPIAIFRLANDVDIDARGLG